MDRFEIAGNRMAANDPVGEAYLYGSDAVELIARGLVDEGTMRRYRSAAYFHRKDMYGQEAATAWEDSAKARHDAARVVYRERKAA